MNEIVLSPNDRFVMNEKTYLILHLTSAAACIIEQDISKLSINYLPCETICDGIRNGSIKMLIPRDSQVIEIDSLPEHEQHRYESMKKMMKEMDDLYGPCYIDLCGKKPKPELKELISRYEISSKTFWKTVRRYLQSGKDPVSLIDTRYYPNREYKDYEYKKRPGPTGHEELPQSKVILSDEIKKQFNEALNQYKKGRTQTIKGVYDDLINKHYTEIVCREDGSVVRQDMPFEQIPTYRQFYNYVQSHLTKEEKDMIKTSKAEVRNNKRLLLSDAQHGIHGPGDMVEIDAMETDVSLRPMLPNQQSVGRAVLYVMIDVYSRLILAISLSFENNSVTGMTNLLLNLFDDKKTYAAKYGIDIDPALWPGNIIPRRARVDRGAEFRSDKLSRIFNDLGIERKLVSPASGSLKGIVEQNFRQMSFNQNAFMENIGLIEKRHDSRHHEEASLTINEFTAMCIQFVLSHNQKVLQYYRPTRKMQDENVPLVPVKLWEFGCRQYGAPRPIVNHDQFLWSLLSPGTATMSRKGLEFHKHYYMDLQDKQLAHEMFDLGSKTKKIDIRYDPRDIGTIYRLQDGKLNLIPLNPLKSDNKGFEVMSEFDREVYEKQLNIQKGLGRRQNDRINQAERHFNKQVTDSLDTRLYNSKDDMRQARAAEKIRTNAENAISTRIVPDTEPSGTIPMLTDSSSQTNPKAVKHISNAHQNLPAGAASGQEYELDDVDFTAALEEFDKD